MMGSIDAWFYKYLAGIQLDEENPAYSSFTIKPLLLKGLDFANAKLETIKGTVSSSWKKEAGNLTIKIEVPFNTLATVHIPASKNVEIFENGIPLKNADGIEFVKYSNGVHQIKVPSGNYVFTMNQN
jgi:alpha-L-rhamnosidase